MCNLPKPRSTENFQEDKNFDIICGSNDQDLCSVQNRLDTSGPTQLEFKMVQPTSVPVDSNVALPHIPFSSTFGKSENLQARKSDQFRLSLDSQTLLRRRLLDGEQHLRRRARSTEGCMLRNNRIDFLEGVHSEGKRNSVGSSVYSALSTTSLKSEGGSRGTHKTPTQENNMQSRDHFYDERRITRRRSVIPIEHPFKIIWDVSTVVLSIAHSYLTHMAIRDRRFEASPFISFCQAWFLVDILLNFFTERKTNTGEIICDHRRIVARYLTSWFAVDILSLIPWEVLYVKPLIDVQNRRGFFQKSFFRSKAVVRVTRHLRGKHFRWFGTVAKHTKHHGIGAQRLLRLIIKYVPKYVMFLRNMKGVVAMRILRFVHWSRRSFKNIESKASDVPDKDMNSSRGDDDRRIPRYVGRSDVWKKQSFEIAYEWGKIDDDGVPL